jgi:hypothetical protein
MKSNPKEKNITRFNTCYDNFEPLNDDFEALRERFLSEISSFQSKLDDVQKELVEVHELREANRLLNTENEVMCNDIHDLIEENNLLLASNKKMMNTIDAQKQKIKLLEEDLEEILQAQVDDCSSIKEKDTHFQLKFKLQAAACEREELRNEIQKLELEREEMSEAIKCMLRPEEMKYESEKTPFKIGCDKWERALSLVRKKEKGCSSFNKNKCSIFDMETSVHSPNRNFQGIQGRPEEDTEKKRTTGAERRTTILGPSIHFPDFLKFGIGDFRRKSENYTKKSFWDAETELQKQPKNNEHQISETENSTPVFCFSDSTSVFDSKMSDLSDNAAEITIKCTSISATPNKPGEKLLVEFGEAAGILLEDLTKTQTILH